jgi:hypothetical protein
MASNMWHTEHTEGCSEMHLGRGNRATEGSSVWQIYHVVVVVGTTGVMIVGLLNLQSDWPPAMTSRRRVRKQQRRQETRVAVLSIRWTCKQSEYKCHSPTFGWQRCDLCWEG